MIVRDMNSLTVNGGYIAIPVQLTVDYVDTIGDTMAYQLDKQSTNTV